ncbi:MAG: cobalamin biosynthesis protein [Gammaproteobacteria bacterium]|nr:cobalamin biosynthesis protein [Gammaproteobacteria bacterium]MCP5424281.1 cobalamin biosynthesis protein [Gammaproteobacteria bacterium]MCP5459034.1 cobalamin biosynthesis protein [Gammaproteobacteria bacterium]
MMLALTVLGAVALERLYGGMPPWQQPVTGFTWLVQRVETYGYGPERLPNGLRLLFGALVLAVMLFIGIVITGLLVSIPYLGGILAAAVLALTLRTTEVRASAQAIAQALQNDDLAQAQARLHPWVEHDCGSLDEEGVSAATIEKLLIQSHDALFGALFWFVLAGAPGAVFFRLSLLCAERWGHATPRYRYFGWSAACLAGILRYLPIGLTALGYSLAGDRKTAWRCRRQIGAWSSPGMGAVLAMAAGAMHLQLGGPIHYFQHRVYRPTLGEGVLPIPQDIPRALRLVDRTLSIGLVAIVIGAWLAT